MIQSTIHKNSPAQRIVKLITNLLRLWLLSTDICVDHLTVNSFAIGSNTRSMILHLGKRKLLNTTIRTLWVVIDMHMTILGKAARILCYIDMLSVVQRTNDLLALLRELFLISTFSHVVRYLHRAIILSFELAKQPVTRNSLFTSSEFSQGNLLLSYYPKLLSLLRCPVKDWQGVCFSIEHPLI